jgi:hypothetical protein
MAELFENFEINRTPRGPRLWRTVAGSFALHAALFALVAYVPTLQSMLHIARLFSDAGYVEEDYELADVRERATMITFAPHEKLYYPPGYFSTNAPTAPVADAQIVEQARPLPTPRPRPTPRPTPQPTPQPTPSPAASASPEVAANKQNAPGEPLAGATPADPSATPDADKKTDEEMEKLAQQTKTKRFPKINVQPFKDLLKKSKALMDSGELDLTGTISMAVEADRNDDGTLANIVVTKVSTDNAKLKATAIEFVQALSASKALVALEGTRHLTMTVESNPTLVSANVTTSMDTPERASEMALGYNGMLLLGRLSKSGRDEAEIYKNMRVAASGKTVSMSFGMSRPAVAKMLEKQVRPT